MKNTKKILFTFFVSAFSLLLISNYVSSQQTAGELFEKALYMEEAKGDLQKAIELYQKILKQFPENREVAAKAQLQIGMCYEKLGLKEAQKAYQKVIDNFPERQEEVAIAKERIAALSRALEKVPSKPTFRKIRIPANPGSGVLSPDGKNIVFASEGCIWSVPIHGKVDPDIAGAPVRLTEATETMRAWDWGGMLALSADGKWIAFNAIENERMEIYIVPSSGGEPKKVPVDIDRGGYGYYYRLSLSPDGKVLAFASYEEEEQSKGKINYIYTIPVEGGTAKKLTEVMATQPAFSPDGKKIAYVKSYLSEPGKTQTDVWVMPASGGSPVQVSDCPSGRARSPVWSPDGKRIYFRGVRDGPNISSVPAGGGEVTIVLPFRSDKGIYESAPGGGNDISPDGKKLVFSGAVRVDKDNIISHEVDIYTVPIEGGEPRVIVHVDKLSRHAELAWSPDGKKLAYTCEGKIWVVAPDGGEPVEVKTGMSAEASKIGWSPDGKKIAFVHWTEGDHELWLMEDFLSLIKK